MKTEIVTSIHENLILMFLALGKEINLSQDMFIVDSTIPIDIFNGVFDSNPDSITPTTIKKVIDYFSSLKKPFCWWHISNKHAPFLKDQLINWGFTPIGLFYGLAMELHNKKPLMIENSHIELTLVSNEQQLHDWLIPFQTAFNFPHSLQAPITDKYKQELFYKNFVHFVAYLDHQPVGSASLFLNPNKTCSFINLGVLPQFRNQGIGKLLQQIRFNYAIKHGYNLAVIQAADSSLALSKRLGFIEYDIQLQPFMFSKI